MHWTDKRQKLEYKLYCRNTKRCRKKLQQIIKNWGPWDYGFIEGVVIQMLRGMEEYYYKGYNVWAKETKEWDSNNKDAPTRYEIIHHLLGLYDTYTNMDYKYYMTTEKNGDIKIKSSYSDKKIKAMKQKEQDLKTEFWNYFRDNIEELWD